MSNQFRFFIDILSYFSCIIFRYEDIVGGGGRMGFNPKSATKLSVFKFPKLKIKKFLIFFFF